MKMSKRAWALLLALVLTAGNILTASAAASPHSDPVVYDYDEKYKLIITPSTNTLSFSTDALSPFVIVSYREGTVPKKSGGEGITSPRTGYDAVTEGCLFLKEWFAELF